MKNIVIKIRQLMRLELISTQQLRCPACNDRHFPARLRQLPGELLQQLAGGGFGGRIDAIEEKNGVSAHGSDGLALLESVDRAHLEHDLVFVNRRQPGRAFVQRREQRHPKRSKSRASFHLGIGCGGERRSGGNSVHHIFSAQD